MPYFLTLLLLLTVIFCLWLCSKANVSFPACVGGTAVQAGAVLSFPDIPWDALGTRSFEFQVQGQS